jgi:transposase
MKHLPFTPEQEQALKQFLQNSKRPQDRERAKALLALQKGLRMFDIALVMNVNPRTIGEWKHAFLSKGIPGIAQKPYPGNHAKLTKGQKEHIKTIIHTKTPHEVGVATQRFWDVPALKQLVLKECDISYVGTRTYERLFQSCGFSYHKVGTVNRHQKQEQIDQFFAKMKKRYQPLFELGESLSSKTKPESN